MARTYASCHSQVTASLQEMAETFFFTGGRSESSSFPAVASGETLAVVVWSGCRSNNSINHTGECRCHFTTHFLKQSLLEWCFFVSTRDDTKAVPAVMRDDEAYGVSTRVTLLSLLVPLEKTAIMSFLPSSHHSAVQFSKRTHQLHNIYVSWQIRPHIILYIYSTSLVSISTNIANQKRNGKF